MKDKAYVINLATRPDRWNKMLERWPELDLIRYDGIVLPKPENETNEQHIDRATYGLGYTHMRLFKEALLRGEKTVLIMEDDAIPQKYWLKRWNEQKAYLDAHLDDWEVFNGAAYGLLEVDDITKLPNSLILHAGRSGASHFCYYNLRAIDKFFEWEKDKEPVDMFYSNVYHRRFKYMCAFPILSIQDDGHSDIIEGNRDWAMVLQKNELQYKRLLGDLYNDYAWSK